MVHCTALPDSRTAGLNKVARKTVRFSDEDALLIAGTLSCRIG